MYIQNEDQQDPINTLGYPVNFGDPVDQIQNALMSGQWYLALTTAVLSGVRDVNRLTNMIFFARHPGRNGRKLDPQEPGFHNLSQGMAGD
jgi:hypothetical protein